MKKLRESALTAANLGSGHDQPQEEPGPKTSADVDRRHLVIGLGASAGGLEAIKALVSQLPPDLDVAIVVIQHLSSHHRSMMVQLLARTTGIKVREAQPGHKPERNCIHIAPANANLILVNGVFKLLEPGDRIQPKPSVNVFFRSLADNYLNNAVGVILSGTGSDGADGIRAIREAGGITFAQDPKSAKYDGMPISAIDTGCINKVLTPEKIAEQLCRLIGRGNASLLPESSDLQSSALQSLFTLLRKHCGVDFSEYKETTIHRRIERRMLACNAPSIEVYVQWLGQHPEELDRLYQDILISVTAFFRDIDAFKALKEEVRRCVSLSKPGDHLRIWVPGCATGEEAYSIAMLFAAELTERMIDVRVQIYATDIDMAAMAAARKAQYPSNAVAGIDPVYLHRYFTQADDLWQVVKPIRAMVVFARHDLVKDPPFLRINMISCRNVLIYFSQTLQERVLQTFHYALLKDGTLFLGRSESIHFQENLFTTVNKWAKLYRPKVLHSRPAHFHINMSTPARTTKAHNAPLDYVQLAARHYVPPGVLLNARHEILTVHGDVSRFLSVTQGKFDADIMRLIKRRYRAELLALLHQAKTRQATVQGRTFVLDDSASEPRQMRIVIHHVTVDNANLFVVSFEIETLAIKEKPLSESEVDGARHKDLEQELNLTKEHLQTVIEELETSNEELQSVNEELQATNEELQTANEQMQTSNEELQSTNEELVTVNEELQVKTTELSEANLELENIQHCIGFALVILDSNLKIVQANEPAQRLFDLNPDNFEHISDITLEPADLPVHERLNEVLSGRPSQQFYVRKNLRDYSLRIGPWRNSAKSIVGVVMTFVDRTELAQTERHLVESRHRLLAVMENSAAMISIKDLAGRYEYVNPAFLQTFQRDASEILGKDNQALFDNETQADIKAKELIVLSGQRSFNTEDTLQLADGKHVLLSFRFPIRGSDGSIRAICTKSFDISERKRMESSLQHQTALLSAVLDSLSATIAVIDGEGNIVTVNNVWQAFAERYGVGDRNPLGIGANYLRVIEKSAGEVTEAGGIGKAICDVLHGDRSMATTVYPCMLEGRRHWFQMTVTPLASGPGGAVIAHTDITEQRDAEAHLRLVAAVFERSSEGILILDRRGYVEKVNAACCHMTGMEPHQMTGSSWRSLRITPLPLATVHEIVKSLRNTGLWQGELALQRDMLMQYPVWVNLNAVRDGDGNVTHYIVLFVDISRLKAAEKSLYNLAYHDSLTGLPNRSLLLERITHALAGAERRNKPLGLMFLDLDRFKIINDSLGHIVGDQLLRAAAHRIEESVRKNDMVARVGGDEFVVMLEDLRLAEDAAITARKIIAALAHPFEISGHEVVVGTSIGITLYPQDGQTVEELLKNADAAMYIAKEQGRNRYQFFTSRMHQYAQRRLWLENQLRQAIHRNELSLHYQPQIELATHEWRGLEALVRWTHEEHGEVPPTEFIPVAEETHLIEEIGIWVLRTACDAFKRLRKFVPSLQTISVNVSAHQLREPDFVENVDQILQDTDLPATCLELEITETVFVEHFEMAAEVIQKLKNKGVRFSLDDFGTGYSSLSYLRRFPINTVKIDESFIRDILSDSNDVAIVQAILALGEVMGLDVVAEGVENDEQFRLLQEWGCKYCQGFYTGRPAAEEHVINAAERQAPM